MKLLEGIEPRKWWTDGEYISNHMDESEDQLRESDFFQVVQLEDYRKLERMLQLAIKQRDYYKEDSESRSFFDSDDRELLAIAEGEK
jgi:hypothetical protein